MAPRYEIPIPEIPFHDMVLGLVWQQHLATPHKKAFMSAEDEIEYLTFGEFYSVVHSLASFLEDIGFNQGQVATVCLPNSWHYAAMFLAVASRGGVTTGLSDLYTAFETQKQLKDSTSSLVFTTSNNLHKILSVAKDCPNLKTVILVDENVPNLSNTSLKIYTWNESTTKEPLYDRSKVKINVKNDLLALPYSSGTTGVPKGVMITHYNYVAQFLMFATHAAQYFAPFLEEDDEEQESEYAVGYLPFYHAYGFFGLCASLMRGSTMIIVKKFSPELLLKLIQKYQIKHIQLVPALVNLLSKSPVVSKYDISCLRSVSCGAGPLDQKTADAVKRRFTHIKFVFQAYGMTEMTVCTHASNLGSSKNVGGTVGITAPNVECKIVNPSTGEMCKVGEAGEVLVKGPNMMKGYWNNEAATREIIDKDGWLHTGDIGSEDNEGNLYIHDRIKELIKVKSFQVPPAELEAVILTHPEVQDVAVIGIPDEAYGEIPRAFVVKRTEKVTPDSIMKFVRDRVSHYKELKGGVEFIKEIPRNPTGKILRRYLKEAFSNRKRNRIAMAKM